MTAAVNSVSSPAADTGTASAGSDGNPQMLVLIGADGGRATVSHAIASEASFLLRDLLDGQDFAGAAEGSTVRVRWNTNGGSTAPHATTSTGSTEGERQAAQGRRAVSPTTSDASDSGEAAVGQLVASQHQGHGVVHTGTVVGTVKGATAGGHSGPAIDLDAELFATPGTEPPPPPPPQATAVPDLMSFFQANPDAGDSGEAPKTAGSGQAAPGPNNDDAAWNSFLRSSPKTTHNGVSAETQQGVPPAAHPSPPLAPRPAVVELPFPYFRGDILERVCQHMSYRFRTSTFGAENGDVRVYCVAPREIPKPMVLPLSEYLDAQDRLFVSEWSEALTLEMLKAATFLNYDALYQLASAKLASIMTEKPVEGIRALLGVEGDFDAAEETELKKEQVVELPRL